MSEAAQSRRDSGPAVAGGGLATPGDGPALAPERARLGRLRDATRYLGVVPFFVYVALFLFWPTAIVLIGAFRTDTGRATLGNVSKLVHTATYVDAFRSSVELSAATAVAGAVAGALLAWAVIAGNPEGLIRRTVMAASGVLAQFGGVMLTFAFLATYGYTGLVTMAEERFFGLSPYVTATWIYTMFGLGIVYTFFQIPLMVLLFLPALDNLQPQWQEATSTLGGGSWAYWRYVAGPILVPPFVSALLLLFVSAFSAYATAAALLSQGDPIVPLQIRTFMESEVIVGEANMGKALALGMVVVVAIVMTIYALLQRSTKWRVQ